MVVKKMVKNSITRIKVLFKAWNTIRVYENQIKVV